MDHNDDDPQNAEQVAGHQFFTSEQVNMLIAGQDRKFTAAMTNFLNMGHGPNATDRERTMSLEERQRWIVKMVQQHFAFFSKDGVPTNSKENHLETFTDHVVAIFPAIVKSLILNVDKQLGKLIFLTH